MSHLRHTSPALRLCPSPQVFVADRYWHLASMVWSVPLAVASAKVFASKHMTFLQKGGMVSCWVSAQVLMGLQSSQAMLKWTRGEDLWTHAAVHHPRDCISHYNLGKPSN